MSEQLKKSSTLGGIDINHDHCVRIPYDYIHDGMRGRELWNEVCAKAIEMFGLPGNKYSCRFTKSNIEFWFLEEKDAILFELTCG